MNAAKIYEDALRDFYTGVITLQQFEERIRISRDVEPVIRCKDCKFSHLTTKGECKYCDIWFPDEKTYVSGDYYCASAERRTE